MNEQRALQLLTAYFQEAGHTWHRIADELRTTFANMDDLSFAREKPATRFILVWMRELKRYHSNFGSLFKRQKRPPVADDFTAAVALSLEQFLAARGFPGMVRCEQTTHQERGALRPDVSLRSPPSDSLVATVECKSDLGWDRGDWRVKFQERTQKLQSAFPGCASYLCVLHKKDWDCNEKQWYCLCRFPPTRLGDVISDSDILAPIEPMFVDILARMHSAINQEFVSAFSKMSESDREKVLSDLKAQRAKSD
jgi:hypothetical protein